MADYKHGEMDVTTQTDTFNGFVAFSTKFVVAVIVLVIFMAIFLT